MERGYVKLWRKTLDSGLLQHPTAWQVFGYLLMSATRARRKLMVAGQVFELEPGDYAVSVASLCEELKITTRQCRTALNVLQKLEIVTIKTTNKGSLISLINWHRYQDERQTDDKQNDKQATNTRQTGDKPIEQEVKNINITPVTSLRSVTVPTGDTPTPKKKAGSTIFRPPSLEEVEAYCRERENAVDAGKWWDFYQSKGWMVGKTKMKDWKAAVRTWEREAGKAEPQEDWKKLFAR